MLFFFIPRVRKDIYGLYCIPIQGRNILHPKAAQPPNRLHSEKRLPMATPILYRRVADSDDSGGSEKGSGIPVRFCWNLSRKTWHGFWYWRFILISSVTWWKLNCFIPGLLGPRCLVIGMFFNGKPVSFFACPAKFEIPHRRLGNPLICFFLSPRASDFSASGCWGWACHACLRKSCRYTYRWNCLNHHLSSH